MDVIRKVFTAALQTTETAGDLIEITLKSGAVHRICYPIVIGDDDLTFSSQGVPATRVTVAWSEVATVGTVKNLTF